MADNLLIMEDDMYHDSWKRLYSAVLSLCAAEPSIQKRLTFALQELAFLSSDCSSDCYPSDIGETFSDIDSRIAEYHSDLGGPSEGSISAWCNTLTEDEAYEVAKQILSAYDTVAREYCS